MGRTNQGSQSRNDSTVVRPQSTAADTGMKNPVKTGWIWRFSRAHAEN